MNGLSFRSDDGGISVIEVAVVSAISALLLASILPLVDSGARVEHRQAARSRTLSEIRLAMSRLTREVRHATWIDPASERSRLVFNAPLEGIETRRISYDLTDGILTRTLGDGTPVAVIEGVTSATPFCYDPPDCAQTGPMLPLTFVAISLTMRVDAPRTPAVTMSTEVELRNI